MVDATETSSSFDRQAGQQSEQAAAFDATVLLAETQRFFLDRIAVELARPIDWRAAGHGRSLPVRVAIYSSALVRDLLRIPAHHRDGIAQARFRQRVAYISDTAIPTLRFFLERFPMEPGRRVELVEAMRLLESAVSVTRDGPFGALDDWYATMDEFHELTQLSRSAARSIRSDESAGG